MLKKIVQGIFFTGFSIQIALGLIWMSCNLFSVQNFAEVSAGAYRWIVQLIGRAYPAVYLLQIAAAIYAGGRLVGQLCGCGEKSFLSFWGGLALLTFPMAMQCHLALLPYSFVCSAGLLQLSFCCELFRLNDILKSGQNAGNFENAEPAGGGMAFGFRPLAGVCVCYLIQAALLPEYLFLGAVPTVLALWLARRELARREKRVRVVMLLAVTVLAAVGMGVVRCGWREANTKNDISGFQWTMAKRVCWPTIWVDAESMPSELREAVDAVLWECHCYPESMDALFKPAVESAMEAKKAKQQLMEMTAYAWSVHSPMVIRQIGWDVLGYSVSPVILQQQLAGGAYESHSGVNYAVMRSRAPILTKYYINYSCWWFAAAVILTAVWAAARLVRKERLHGERERKLFLTAVAGAVCCVFWYVMQGAGIMDYKYTVLTNEIWLLWSLSAFVSCADSGGQRGKGA